MAALVDSIAYFTNKLWEQRDTRVDGWPLMSSPLPAMAICLAYVFIVKVLGPKFMENRPAYDLRRVLLFYNLFQIVVNVWVFYELSRYGWLSGNYSFVCQPVDYSYDEAAVRVLRACYVFYLSKFVDLFDTFFFILRKKNNQITLLHIIHHGWIPTTLWPGIRFVCGGHGSFFAFLNSLVHVVMYFYYFLAAMGPQVQKYLGWKKYLTTFQMVQFIAASIHCFQLLFIDCDFPYLMSCWIGIHEVFFLLMFLNFYRHTYHKNKKMDSSSKSDINNNNNVSDHKKHM
nr:elongation of very long chain fatty acids protein 1 [Daphnia magna]